MYGWLAVAAAGGIAASARAAPTDLRSRVFRPDSVGYKHGVYDFATGRVEADWRTRCLGRLDPIIWQSQRTTGYFLDLRNCGRPGEITELVMDWGDVIPQDVTGCTIAYGTDATTDPNAITLIWAYSNNTNGFGDNEIRFIAGFYARLPGLPPGFPYQYVGWFVTFDFFGSGNEFALGDRDLDADGRADFGYCYTVLDYGDSTRSGPVISEPNDPLSGPGAVDAFDLYVQDANHPCADPNAMFFYDGTYDFGGAPFAQFHMVLYGGRLCCCPYPGCDDGDLDCDCDVDLADLSDLLDAFGCNVGDPCYNADDDIDGGGAIGVSDLSALLSQYGNLCF